MRTRIGYMAPVALLLGACTAPTDLDPKDSNAKPLFVGRFGSKIAPRKIKPAITPLGLDTKPVKVMVQVEGDPVSVVQAQTPDHKLTQAEKGEVRERLRGVQASVRPHIEALGGTILREYQSAYNGLTVHIARKDLALLAQVPGVLGVHPLRVMKPTTTRAVPFVGGSTVWSGGVSGFRGESMKVAIIDTGIDYTHANFGGPGTTAAYETAHANETQSPDPALIGPGAPRIKGGIDLVGDGYDASSTDPLKTVPHPDPNPLDCNGHGSHVAGITGGSGVTTEGLAYAGPYDATTYNQAFRIGPGVAPRTDLYAVRVFGCDGSTDVTVDAIEWSVENDMDVINMSLGSTFGSADDPSSVAASNAVRAGVVVIASAGNDGGNYYMAGAPASGDGVLSVAATDATPTYPGASLALGTSSIQVLNANNATFSDSTTYPVVVLGTPGAIGLGCTAAEYALPNVPGALVVTMRGTCARVDRATLAQQAGAAAVAMINTDENLPPFEGDVPNVTIPFFGVRPADAAALTSATSVTATNVTLQNPGYRVAASFTSGGPRFGDSVLKPNLIAPGVSVVSAGVGTGAGALTLSGTSMSGPVVAGLAALARQAHGTWRADDIAAAITNTADPRLVTAYSTRVSGVGVPQAPLAIRTGAVAASAGAPAVSFGFLELGSNRTEEREVVVRNNDNAAMVFNVLAPANFTQGVTHTLAHPSQVRVPARGTARFSVQVALSPTAPSDPIAFNEFAGVIELAPASARINRGVTLRIPYYGVVRPVARLNASVDVPRRRDPNGSATVNNWRSPIAGTADLYAWGIEGARDNIGCNDVRAVGVQSAAYGEGDRLLVFAINGWRRCSNSAVNEYDVMVTTQSGAQYAVIGVDAGYAQTGSFTGDLGTLIVNLAAPDQGILMPASAPTDSGTIYLAALASQLGLTAELPRFSYLTQTFNLAGEGDDPPSETGNFNAYSSAVVGQGQYLTVDPNRVATAAIGVDRAEWALTPAKGLMVVLFENSPGADQAEVFRFPALAP